MGPHAPGGAALGEGTFLELGDAVADVECVGHGDGVRDALAVFAYPAFYNCTAKKLYA